MQSTTTYARLGFSGSGLEISVSIKPDFCYLWKWRVWKFFATTIINLRRKNEKNKNLSISEMRDL